MRTNRSKNSTFSLFLHTSIKYEFTYDVLDLFNALPFFIFFYISYTYALGS